MSKQLLQRIEALESQVDWLKRLISTLQLPSIQIAFGITKTSTTGATVSGVKFVPTRIDVQIYASSKADGTEMTKETDAIVSAVHALPGDIGSGYSVIMLQRDDGLWQIIAASCDFFMSAV